MHGLDSHVGDGAWPFQHQQFVSRMKVRQRQLGHEESHQAMVAIVVQPLGLLQQDAQLVSRSRPARLDFLLVTLDDTAVAI